MDGNENTTDLNCSYAATAVPRGKHTALKHYVRKEESLKTNDLCFQLREGEKAERSEEYREEKK